MARARGGPGDADKAARLTARALAAYRELGMDAYAARVGAG